MIYSSLTHPLPEPAAYYAQFAKLFRERGLEVQDNDYELIDLAIQECNRLLDIRSFIQSESR